ncbi:MAG TPA: TetR/AcrR family transcriptional regulator [Nitriliruptoraceae bacterium]|nr:TetR/AcrR family transcriptional regulator [Nitriliruptoraceae bacterium]
MPRTRMTGPQRREQLIAVGRGVFADNGYAAATVEEIAERAGVSKPVVYEHFGGKDGLYEVVVQEEIEELTARMGAAVSTSVARIAGEQAALAFLTYIDEREDGFRVLVRDTPMGQGTGGLATVMSVIAVRVEQLLRDNFRDKGFDDDAAPMYARMLIGAVALVGEWWLEDGKRNRDDVVAHIVNLLWYGLRDLRREPPPLVSVGDGVRADLDVMVDAGMEHDRPTQERGDAAAARARRFEGVSR